MLTMEDFRRLQPSVKQIRLILESGIFRRMGVIMSQTYTFRGRTHCCTITMKEENNCSRNRLKFYYVLYFIFNRDHCLIGVRPWRTSILNGSIRGRKCQKNSSDIDGRDILMLYDSLSMS